MPMELKGSKEYRRIDARLEVRADGAGAGEKVVIEGYGALFDKEADLYWFREVIRPGAFTTTLKDADVRALFNHDPNFVLGRNKSGTLRLREDTRGLRYDFDPPATAAAKDVVELIRRGDVTQSSFGFRTLKDRWTFSDNPNEPALRELLEVELFDVSPVTFPAYPDTVVGVRSKEDFKAVLDDARLRHGAGDENWEEEAALLLAELED